MVLLIVVAKVRSLPAITVVAIAGCRSAFSVYVAAFLQSSDGSGMEFTVKKFVPASKQLTGEGRTDNGVQRDGLMDRRTA